MIYDDIISRFRNSKDKIAFYFDDNEYTYYWLSQKINYWTKFFINNKINEKEILFLKTENNPNAIAILLSCMVNKIILIPVTPSQFNKTDKLIEICTPNYLLDLTENEAKISELSFNKNKLYNKLDKLNSGGLVLFSSGTTGKSKGTLHSFKNLLFKYQKLRKDHRTLSFMFIDHIGGIDTLLYCLSNTSTIIIVNDRSPDIICKLIEKYKVEILPTTPSFLNLLILSEAFKKYNLSSLKYITYGTEPMPEHTLKKCNLIFKGVNIIQKFGATEVGTLGSKSKSSSSIWIKLGGLGFETRVRENKLEIKSKSSMVGYLNAPSPFTEDGWFKTNDRVEVKNGYYKILGRESEIINVGGEKVFPSEVENIILELNEIKDVTIFGSTNPILGNIVCAEIVLISDNINKMKIKKLIKEYCSSKLENFKVPVKIKFTEDNQHSERFKKLRLNL